MEVTEVFSSVGTQVGVAPGEPPPAVLFLKGLTGRSTMAMTPMFVFHAPGPAAHENGDPISDRPATPLSAAQERKYMISLNGPSTTMSRTCVGMEGLTVGRTDLSAVRRTIATVIRPSGEIDIFTSHALRESLLRVLRHSKSTLIVDLSGVSFCDASGLAVLVGIQRRARSMGITLALSSPRPFMARLLRITGLDRSLPIAA
ncbi:STAS domain-containing protein [Spongiactinospora sp. TRM90649]|uniref:STAS domain-containing protein n=1 Tax=Spongiactinospora sp. TRM90649 TaxID=3031114 RepID=UPI0023F9D6E2|nr:STAS domain-containing protein [Spongiactinospora sp. TRM90649]MDF5756241.1 STAS domain-containing protein [Spongiactinospora sp. TRM90649]